MESIPVGNESVAVAASFGTLLLYEEQFNSNLLTDLFNAHSVRQTDSGDAYIDYKAMDWGFIMRALWACAKTADESVPRFREWANGIGGELDMKATATLLLAFLFNGFFHAGASQSLGEESE